MMMMMNQTSLSLAYWKWFFPWLYLIHIQPRFLFTIHHINLLFLINMNIYHYENYLIDWLMISLSGKRKKLCDWTNMFAGYIESDRSLALKEETMIFLYVVSWNINSLFQLFSDMSYGFFVCLFFKQNGSVYHSG